MQGKRKECDHARRVGLRVRPGEERREQAQARHPVRGAKAMWDDPYMKEDPIFGSSEGR